jgi:hypothetical protein
MIKRKNPDDWLPTGRPTLYQPEFCRQILDYFDVEPYRVVTRVNKRTGHEYSELAANPLPTLAGFASQIGVARQTLHNWGKEHPEFFDAIARAKATAEYVLVTNGLLGLYHARFAIFVAKNYTDLRDVTDVTVQENPKPRSAQEVIERIRELDQTIAELQAQL